MDIANWLLEQSGTVKLLIGLGCGIICYGLLRWFAYSANKSYQQTNPKKATREDKLRNLFGQ
jgi:hypothetical protein